MAEMSMVDKVRELGLNPVQFQKDMFEINDAVIEKCFLGGGYSRENLQKYVYPKLRQFKKKYGIDLPFSITGVDLARLDARLDSALMMKGW